MPRVLQVECRLSLEELSGCRNPEKWSTPGYRVICKLCYGEIPDGYDVDHICENKSCIRPSHLQAITHLWNMNLVGIRNELRRRGDAPPKQRTDSVRVLVMSLNPRGESHHNAKLNES